MSDFTEDELLIIAEAVAEPDHKAGYARLTEAFGDADGGVTLRLAQAARLGDAARERAQLIARTRKVRAREVLASWPESRPVCEVLESRDDGTVLMRVTE